MLKIEASINIIDFAPTNHKPMNGWDLPSPMGNHCPTLLCSACLQYINRVGLVFQNDNKTCFRQIQLNKQDKFR